MNFNLTEKLYALQEQEYRDFQAKIIPNIDKDTLIGVRAPKLKKVKKELENSPFKDDFLKLLPHNYYEENILHAWIVASIKDYDECLKEVEIFLPYIDNWSVCDTFTPACFKDNLENLEKRIELWIRSDHPYTVRFGIEMLMKFYLEDNFNIKYPEMVASVENEDYYVNMMIAWYFATALAKQYEKILPFIEKKKLNNWCHNKTIQKAVESFRITDEQKIYLKTMKIK